MDNNQMQQSYGAEACGQAAPQPETTGGMQPEALAAAKKHFSKLGLMYFLGTLIVNGVQIGTYEILLKVNRSLTEAPNFTFLLMLIMYVFGIPFMVLLIRRVPRVDIPRRRIGGRLAVAAIMAWAIMYCSNLIGVVLTTIISLVKGSSVGNVMGQMTENASLLMLFVFTVLLAPPIEELVFRKLLIDRAAGYGEGVAILLSGLMFGLFHGNLSQFVYAFTLGCFLAFIYVRTGDVKNTIILHMIINFLGGVLGPMILRMTGQNPAMTDLVPMLILVVYFLCIVGVVIAGVVLLIINRKKFKLQQGAGDIPKGKRFGTVIWNAGTILYILFWIGMILWQLLS